MNTWTDEEINTLVSMWPNASIVQIADTLHRSYSAIRLRAKRLREDGLLESKNPASNKPDRRDFDKVKRDYCRKHHIDMAQLCKKLERNVQRSCIGWLKRPSSQG
jgi:transposase